MSTIASLILSMLMLATVLLGAGGVWVIVKRGDRKRGVLMLIAAVVMLANVLISAWPV
ncbi:hypothetical protein [Sphingomonas montanisoli]|uniref:hypothetical protein n=1 Tax=Sphingomonas montanisoli TaxID=2606412 RepID=UPI0015E1703C|nr:hypothetical protein [Sphingomonas montanisoli]